MMTSNKHLLLGEGLLKSFGYSKENQHISKSLEAIIGHELGHSTRIKKDVWMIHGTATAPLIVFVGYKIYEYAKHRQQKKKQGSLKQHIEITAKEVERKVGEAIDSTADSPEHADTMHKLKKYSLSVAKNIATYVGISLAFIPVTKYMGRKVEFAADKYGAELVGKEHMIDALKVLDGKTHSVMEKSGIPKIVQNFIHLMDYHPSIASRISRLEKI